MTIAQRSAMPSSAKCSRTDRQTLRHRHLDVQRDQLANPELGCSGCAMPRPQARAVWRSRTGQLRHQRCAHRRTWRRRRRRRLATRSANTIAAMEPAPPGPAPLPQRRRSFVGRCMYTFRPASLARALRLVCTLMGYGRGYRQLFDRASGRLCGFWQPCFGDAQLHLLCKDRVDARPCFTHFGGES